MTTSHDPSTWGLQHQSKANAERHKAFLAHCFLRPGRPVGRVRPEEDAELPDEEHWLMHCLAK